MYNSTLWADEESDFQSYHITRLNISSSQQQKMLQSLQRNRKVGFIQRKKRETFPEET